LSKCRGGTLSLQASGEILADELKDIGISAAALARTLEVPANRISQIIARKRAISADTALRLARYFGTSPDLWMNLQKTFGECSDKHGLSSTATGANNNSLYRRNLNIPVIRQLDYIFGFTSAW
jgi:addiction module HigA family antidote